MRYRLQKLDPMSVGKISAIMYGTMALLFVPFVAIMALASLVSNHGTAVGVVGFAILAVMVPFLYGAIGFVFGALAALIYNFAAGKFGGLEFEIGPVPGQMQQQAAAQGD